MEQNITVGRRNLLKAIGATGAAITASTVLPGEWAKPVMEMGLLPVHAQSSTPDVDPCIRIPTPIDMVLTVDTSGSIGANLGTAKQALLNFVAQRDLTKDKISVVGFDTTILAFSPLSRDKAVIDAGINSLQLGGATSIATGIDKAALELKTGQVSGNPRVIILISDGMANSLRYDDPAKDQAFEAAKAAKAAGIRIITIAIPGDSGVDFALLQDMATSASRDFFYVLSVADLLTALAAGCTS